MAINVRPSWDEYFLQLCYLAATRASCDRKHVGAVIVTADKRVVSTGYNGSPRNHDSCDEVGHEIVDGHCVRTLHAESNAIDFAGRFAEGCTLYVTVTPCYDCAKRIVNAGIARVVYDEFYASRYGKSDQVETLFKMSGVKVTQYDSPGLRLFKSKLKEMADMTQELLKLSRVEYACGCEVSGVEATPRCAQHGALRTHT